MVWFLASAGHQHPWHGFSGFIWSLLSPRRDLNYLYHYTISVLKNYSISKLLHSILNKLSTTGTSSLWPSDVIWRIITWSTRVNVMACCLKAESHYLTQKWLLIIEVLTHWNRDKMAAILQTTFSNAFSWMKILRFHWSLFPMVQIL